MTTTRLVPNIGTRRVVLGSAPSKSLFYLMAVLCFEYPLLQVLPFWVLYGGIGACRKAIAIYEGFGIPCEINVGSFGNIQVLGSTTDETCEYYECGLLGPNENYDVIPPYLKGARDPMDEKCYIQLPQGPGLGIEYNWDYINENLVKE